MSKIKNGGLDQYDAELFEQHQFGTAGVEVVNSLDVAVGHGLDSHCAKCCFAINGLSRELCLHFFKLHKSGQWRRQKFSFGGRL